MIIGKLMTGLDPQATDGQIIVIGLDAAPFERVITDGIRNTLILSFVLLLTGLAGFLSLFWMYQLSYGPSKFERYQCFCR